MLHSLLKNQMKMCIALAFLSLSSVAFAIENKMDAMTQNKIDSAVKAMEITDELKAAIKKISFQFLWMQQTKAILKKL